MLQHTPKNWSNIVSFVKHAQKIQSLFAENYLVTQKVNRNWTANKPVKQKLARIKVIAYITISAFMLAQQVPHAPHTS